MLELLEDGRLTEGHGRALLLAEDHADRRRLARAAAQEGWSVRVTEERAREANDGPRPAHAGPRGRAPRPGGGVREIADALGARARHRGPACARAARGYKVELGLASADEALALARRLGVAAA